MKESIGPWLGIIITIKPADPVRQRRTLHYLIIHYRDFLDFEEAFVFEDFAFKDLIFLFGELLPD